jgi:hypothetical protein
VQRFAEWHEPKLNRPWVALVNRALRHATFGHWASCIGFVAFFVFLGLTSKHSGSLLADDVPRWASKASIALYFCFSIFCLGELTRRRFRELPALSPTEEEPVVLLELRNKWSLTKVDWGHLDLNSGCLAFKGEHTQFLLNLEDFHSTVKNEHDRSSLTIWLPSTGQRVRIFNNSESDRAWESLLDRLQHEAASNLLSTYPPKESPRKWLMGLLWIIGCLALGEILVASTWSLAKKFSGYEDLALVILFPATLCLLGWFALQINLRLWSKHRRFRDKAAL